MNAESGYATFKLNLFHFADNIKLDFRCYYSCRKSLCWNIIKLIFNLCSRKKLHLKTTAIIEPTEATYYFVLHV